jgi:hypothetical protein
VPDVLAHEVIPGDRDDVPPLEVTEAVEDFGHPQGDGGLAGAGVARKRHVQRGPLRREPGLATQAVDHE